MFSKLLVVFIAIPLVELALLVWIGKRVGLGPTIVLVVVTGMLGAHLARQQGFRVWAKIQGELQAGRMPAAEMVDGFLILIGGILLLTPGLLTDLCGLALMIPAVRGMLRARLLRRFQTLTEKKAASMRPPSGGNGDVIDV